MEAYNKHMAGGEKKKTNKKSHDLGKDQDNYWNYWNEDNVEKDPSKPAAHVAAEPQRFDETPGFYEGLMLPAEFANREENEEDRQITDQRQLLFGHSIADELRKEFKHVQERTHNFTFMEVMEGKWANRNLRRRINLEHCRLKGEIPSFDDPVFHPAAKLRVLTLMDNKIEGPMPSFNMFAQLHTLNLSFNGLSGNVPNLEACVKLKYCYLNNNKLEGTLPAFRGCVQLSELWLHCNCLSGVNEWRDDPKSFYDVIGVSLVCSKQYPHLAKKRIGAQGEKKDKSLGKVKQRAVHELGRELLRASLAPGSKRK